MICIISQFLKITMLVFLPVYGYGGFCSKLAYVSCFSLNLLFSPNLFFSPGRLPWDLSSWWVLKTLLIFSLSRFSLYTQEWWLPCTLHVRVKILYLHQKWRRIPISLRSCSFRTLHHFSLPCLATTTGISTVRSV